MSWQKVPGRSPKLEWQKIEGVDIMIVRRNDRRTKQARIAGEPGHQQAVDIAADPDIPWQAPEVD